MAAALAALPAPSVRNVSVQLGANNVVDFHRVDTKNVHLLGVVSSFAACEDACYAATAPHCLSFTWHHTDFGKVEYQGHCYLGTRTPTPCGSLQRRAR